MYKIHVSDQGSYINRCSRKCVKSIAHELNIEKLKNKKVDKKIVSKTDIDENPCYVCPYSDDAHGYLYPGITPVVIISHKGKSLSFELDNPNLIAFSDKFHLSVDVYLERLFNDMSFSDEVILNCAQFSDFSPPINSNYRLYPINHTRYIPKLNNAKYVLPDDYIYEVYFKKGDVIISITTTSGITAEFTAKEYHWNYIHYMDDSTMVIDYCPDEKSLGLSSKNQNATLLCDFEIPPAFFIE